MTQAQHWTVRDLRRRWKPAKLRLQQIRDDHPTVIRVHRCFSWMLYVESHWEAMTHETALIFRWIALNSLYGRWNDENREPAADRRTLSLFADHILKLDQDRQVPEVLTSHKRLVVSIMDDEYLARYYWEEPTIERAKRTKKAVFDVRRCFVEQRYSPILWRLLDRVYLLRCQLVHGAATEGSSLNRTSLRRCNTMLGHLLTAIVLVVIDHGEAVDWGPLCYPPLGNGFAGKGG